MRKDAKSMDRAARDKAAELLRAFVAGAITNDVFENDYRSVKSELSRFALFLESDRLYEWPPHPAGAGCRSRSYSFLRSGRT